MKRIAVVLVALTTLAACGTEPVPGVEVRPDRWVTIQDPETGRSFRCYSPAIERSDRSIWCYEVSANK